MTKLYLIAFFLLSFPLLSQQKYSITGRIIDARSKVAIPFANVYVEGSTIGTQSNEDGTFVLQKLPATKFRLIASVVGYLPYSEEINLLSGDVIREIALEENVKFLGEVKVSARRDKLWERQLKIFEREFLGTDFNRKLVSIRNLEVLDFVQNGDTLRAYANTPLVIDNKLLGYIYHFILENFEFRTNRVAYQGIGRFELRDLGDVPLQQRYERNREKAYFGSLKHFLKASLTGTWEQDGFKCTYINTEQTQTTKELNFGYNQVITTSNTIYPYKPQESVFATDQAQQYLLILDCPLQIIYQQANRNEVSNIKQNGNILVSADGDLMDPYSILTLGAMGRNRVAKTLPFDYEPNLMKKTKPMAIAKPQLPAMLENNLKYEREKVFVEGLESYYLAGEQLHLDIRVKDLWNQNLSNLSKVLYVDLIDLDHEKVLKHAVLKLNEGICSYTMPLDSNLTGACYQIRAYTNWMRNFSERGFFSKNLLIFSKNYQNDLKNLSQKLPEDTLMIGLAGQKLLDKHRVKIALAAWGKHAAPLATEYYLMANKKDTLIVGSTDAAGRAIFEMQAAKDQTLEVLCMGKYYPLPKAEARGFSLSTFQMQKNANFKVLLQGEQPEYHADTLTLGLMQEGQVLQWLSFVFSKSEHLFTFSKENLEGTFTLFLMDKNARLLAEREVYLSSILSSKELSALEHATYFSNSGGFFEVDKNLPFWDEKGISIFGTIVSKTAKSPTKPVTIEAMLDSAKEATYKQASQRVSVQGIEKFVLDSLQFKGHMQLGFMLPEYEVYLDTTASIAPLKNVDRQWDRSLLNKPDVLTDLEQRAEALQTLQKSVPAAAATPIDSIGHENSIDGVPAVLAIPARIISGYINDFIYGNFIEKNQAKYKNLYVFLDEQLIKPDDFEKLPKLVKISEIDKILIFENELPNIYNMADYAIVIQRKKDLDKKGPSYSQVFKVHGYDN